MSSVSESGTRSSGRRIGALILGIVGILLVILGVVYLTVSAGSLPSILGHINGSTGHHPLRAGVSLVVGVVLLIGAWWLGFGGKKSGSSSN